MLNYIKNTFKNIKEALGFIRNAPLATLKRWFTSRRSHYEQLLKRGDEFINAVQASGSVTEIDVSGLEGSRKGSKKNDVSAIRFREGSALPVENFEAPNRKQLAQDVKLLDEYEFAREELREVIQRFQGLQDISTSKFLKSAQDMLNSLDKKAEAILDVLTEIFQRHAPKTLMRLAAAAVRHINDVLPEGTYSDVELDLHVTSNDSLTKAKDAAIEFTYYVIVKDLDKDVVGTEEFLIPITGVVHEVKGDSRKRSYYMTVHVTSLSRFERPGHFDPGMRLSGNAFSAMEAALKREMTKLMSLRGLAAVMGRIPFAGLTQQKLRHSGLLALDGIVDVDLSEDEIVIEFGSKVKDEVIKQELWKQIVIYLRKIVRVRRNTSFTYLLEKDGGRKIMRVTNIKNVV